MSIGKKAKKLGGCLLFGQIVISLTVIFFILIPLIPIIFIFDLIFQVALKGLASTKQFKIKSSSLERIHEVKDDTSPDKIVGNVVYPKLGTGLLDTKDLLFPKFKNGLTFFNNVKNSIKLIIAIPAVFVFLLNKGLEATGLKSSKTEWSQYATEVIGSISLVFRAIGISKKNESQMRPGVITKLSGVIESIMDEHVLRVDQDRRELLDKFNNITGLDCVQFSSMAKNTAILNRIEGLIGVIDSLLELGKIDQEAITPEESKKSLQEKFSENIFRTVGKKKPTAIDYSVLLSLAKLEDDDIQKVAGALASEIDSSSRLEISIYLALLKHSVKPIDRPDDYWTKVQQIANEIASNIAGNLDENELANVLFCNNDLIKEALKTSFDFSSKVHGLSIIIEKVSPVIKRCLENKEELEHFQKKQDIKKKLEVLNSKKESMKRSKSFLEEEDTSRLRGLKRSLSAIELVNFRGCLNKNSKFSSNHYDGHKTNQTFSVSESTSGKPIFGKLANIVQKETLSELEGLLNESKTRLLEARLLALIPGPKSANKKDNRIQNFFYNLLRKKLESIETPIRTRRSQSSHSDNRKSPHNKQGIQSSGANNSTVKKSVFASLSNLAIKKQAVGRLKNILIPILLTDIEARKAIEDFHAQFRNFYFSSRGDNDDFYRQKLINHTSEFVASILNAISNRESIPNGSDPVKVQQALKATKISKSFMESFSAILNLRLLIDVHDPKTKFSSNLQVSLEGVPTSLPKIEDNDILELITLVFYSCSNFDEDSRKLWQVLERNCTTHLEGRYTVQCLDLDISIEAESMADTMLKYLNEEGLTIFCTIYDKDIECALKESSFNFDSGAETPVHEALTKILKKIFEIVHKHRLLTYEKTYCFLSENLARLDLEKKQLGDPNSSKKKESVFKRRTILSGDDRKPEVKIRAKIEKETKILTNNRQMLRKFLSNQNCNKYSEDFFNEIDLEASRKISTKHRYEGKSSEANDDNNHAVGLPPSSLSSVSTRVGVLVNPLLAGVLSETQSQR